MWSSSYLKQGPIDVLINNASAFTKDRLAQSTPERVESELRVNLMAPLELIRQFAQQTDQGAVLNLLDRRIVAHDPSCLAYALSREALFELTKIAALELAPHIRVNGVAPGPILPPPGCASDSLRERAGVIPLDRIPDVAEVVSAGRYLIESPSITGQVIFVDGGQHLLEMESDMDKLFIVDPSRALYNRGLSRGTPRKAGLNCECGDASGSA